MRIALDTNAYSDFRRGLKWLHEVQSANGLLLPLFVVAELKAGFAAGNATSRNEAELKRFLAVDRVSLLLPDEETATQYAALVLHLRRQGTPLPTNDIWIAALCLQHGIPLCTSDRHFDQVP